MDYLKVRNWDKWQTGRKDRGAPPWIKVYRALLTDPQFTSLTDAEKGALLSIWLVAAERQGRVSAVKGVLRKVCMLDHDPPLEKFLELQFLEKIKNRRRHRGVTVASPWQPLDATDQRREEKNNPPLVPPLKKPPKRNPETPTPETLEITDSMAGWAKEKVATINLVVETERFLNHHRSKGNRFRDWPAAWRNWMLRSLEYSAKGNGSNLTVMTDKELTAESTRLGIRTHGKYRQQLIAEIQSAQSKQGVST